MTDAATLPLAAAATALGLAVASVLSVGIWITALAPFTSWSRLRSFLLLAVASLAVPVALTLRVDGPSDLLGVAALAVALGALSWRIARIDRTLERAVADERSEQAAREGRWFSAVVRHATDVLVVIDPSGIVTYASPSARELLGDDPTGWSVRRLARFIHASERHATLSAIFDRLGSADGRPARLNARLVDRGETEQHVELVFVDLRDDPDVGGVVLTIHETSERTALERQLRRLAFHDPLTGLGNRELFRDRLQQALARAQRSGGRVGLLMCDIDDFKDVNDSLGHGIGDQLLQTVAQRLEDATRASDTIARLGGDEFAVLCEDLESARDATTTARRLLEAVDEPVHLGGHELRVGMSVGVAIDAGERTAHELLRDADVALYEAKGQGKRRWALHRAQMTVRSQDRLRLADDLARALADRGLEVAYQPIVDLVDTRVVGFEALARWTHPERGPVPPSTFIEIAESSGLITVLGRQVIDLALATHRRCLDARPGIVLRAGINVSARELREPAMIGDVLGFAEEHRIDPSCIVLELTEHGMLEDSSLTLSVMRQLRNRGVRFAVDDFGTGFSSLSYLRRLPVDIVKIDRSFIDDLAHDSTANDLVRAIVELGRTLQLDVCAEGVETERQRAQLVAIGCGFGQGYLFDRPLTADAFVERVADPSTRVVLEHVTTST